MEERWRNEETRLRLAFVQDTQNTPLPCREDSILKLRAHEVYEK